MLQIICFVATVWRERRKSLPTIAQMHTSAVLGQLQQPSITEVEDPVLDWLGRDDLQ